MANQRPGGQPPPADQTQELLAMVAHDLRRPLTAVRGALATVQHHGHVLPASQQQELLGIAHRQAEQLQRLVDQLLVAAALELPWPSPSRWPLVDASALAEEAARAAQLAHPHHRITIHAAGPLLVRVDPLAISRILGNLLDNAAAHSPTRAPIRLTVSRDGTQAVLAVQDQGPGVPLSERDRIFERYARLDWPAHPRGERTGPRPVPRPAAGPSQPRRAAVHRPPRWSRGPVGVAPPTRGASTRSRSDAPQRRAAAADSSPPRPLTAVAFRTRGRPNRPARAQA